MDSLFMRPDMARAEDDRKVYGELTTIANIIAAQLASPGGNRVRSTIDIQQAKSKFKSVRVYCELGNRDRVNESWELVGSSRSEENNNDEPTEEFIQQAYKRDATLYRRIYLQTCELFPHYKNYIKPYADYPQFLCETQEEIDKWYESVKDRMEEPEKTLEFVNSVCALYKSSTK